jgi:PAS domain S-box-containing protein
MQEKDCELRDRLRQALQELEGCEARWRHIISGSPQGILIVDTDGNVRFANEAAAAIFGCRAEGLLGDRFEPPAVSEKPAELNLKSRDGRTVAVEMWRLETEWGGKPAWFVALQDITERKQAEEALQESEERFRSTFNQVAVGIGHVAPDGRWLRINQKYCDIVGYTEEELKALTIEDITHPDDKEASLKNFRLLLEGKLDNYSLEKRYIRKDGSTLWVNLTASMVTDAAGNQRFAVGVVEDITARKRTEAALQKSEKKFSKIFHSAPALIGISTLVEGRIIDINETGLRTLGYQPEEMIGRTLLELGILENPAEHDMVERMLLKQGPVRNHEINFRGKTGERFTGLLSAELIDMNGERYILAMVRDITLRKRAVEQIEKLNADLATRAAELEFANVELEAFNYTVAHDLRKPLTVINGYCQAIMALCGDRFDDKCRGYLQEAYEGTLHMNRLIDALLDFSRLAHCEIKPESVDLSAMAGEIAAGLRLADPDRRVSFVIAEGVSAEGDPALLRMILENLLGNAWKYTAKRQVARIEFGMTEVDGKQACFVRDNGTGFDMGYAEKLFTPFQRLPGTDEFKGHGIGLATVERIIRRHGGRVWAEGEPGKGATFYFTLSEDKTSARA